MYIAKEKKKEEKRIYSDAAEAGVAREGGPDAGAGRFQVDGLAEAEDSDDVEIVEHACCRAQRLLRRLAACRSSAKVSIESGGGGGAMSAGGRPAIAPNAIS